VADECQRESNLLGAAFLEEHILVVADYGKRMARLLDADSEIVEIAAYLHDISAVQDIATLPVHAVASSEIAVTRLAELNCPSESIERVRQCVLAHKSPLRIGEGSLEEVCLSNADAISQVVKLPYWLYFAFVV